MNKKNEKKEWTKRVDILVSKRMNTITQRS